MLKKIQVKAIIGFRTSNFCSKPWSRVWITLLIVFLKQKWGHHPDRHRPRPLGKIPSCLLRPTPLLILICKCMNIYRHDTRAFTLTRDRIVCVFASCFSSPSQFLLPSRIFGPWAFAFLWGIFLRNCLSRRELKVQFTSKAYQMACFFESFLFWRGTFCVGQIGTDKQITCHPALNFF